MAFPLTERNVDWLAHAPVLAEREAVVDADPAAVWATLADHVGWARWFTGITRVEVDGTGTGVGAQRTVWLGPLWVRERFVEWQPERRYSFCVVESLAPGLGSLVEDLRLEPAGDGRTRVHYAVGAAGKGPDLLDRGLRFGAERIVAVGLKGLAGTTR